MALGDTGANGFIFIDKPLAVWLAKLLCLPMLRLPQACETQAYNGRPGPTITHALERAQVGTEDQPVDAVNDVQVQIDPTERRAPTGNQQASAAVTADKLQQAPKQRRGRSRRVETESEDELSAELNPRKDQC